MVLGSEFSYSGEFFFFSKQSQKNCFLEGGCFFLIAIYQRKLNHVLPDLYQDARLLFFFKRVNGQFFNDRVVN